MSGESNNINLSKHRKKGLDKFQLGYLLSWFLETKTSPAKLIVKNWESDKHQLQYPLPLGDSLSRFGEQRQDH